MSPIDVPGHDNSAMDGYAVRFADLRRERETMLTRVGESFAGKPSAARSARATRCGSSPAASCRRAPTPSSCRSARASAGEASRSPPARSQGRPEPPLRRRGPEARAGRVRAGPAGAPRRARDARIARHRRSDRVSASCASRSSRPATSCARSAQPLARGEIYDSNRYTLYGMLTRLNCEFSTWASSRRPRGDSSAPSHAPRQRRRRDHLRRRVGRRSRLRQAAARQARRGAVLEDRDEAGPPARLRPDRRRAFLRPAGQSGRGDGDVLRIRPRRAAGPAGSAQRRARADVQGAARRAIRKVPGRTEFQRGVLAPDGDGGLPCAPPATRARESCRRCRGRTASSCCPRRPAISPPANWSTCNSSKGCSDPRRLGRDQ